MTGRAIRKTDPHQKCSRSTPPTKGPTALPAENDEIQSAIALARSPESWNMLKMSDSVDGAIVAPAMPSSARLAMSISGLTDTADRIEVNPNAPAPTSRSLRRPTQSPTAPIVTRKPATTNPYMSMIHRSWVLLGCRSLLIAGTARSRTVRSMT